MELSCSQVGALMSFYMENKLSAMLKQYIQRHLETCPACAKKYEDFKNIINKYNNVVDDEIEIEFKQYSEFKKNISAYVDNELDVSENVKIKKMIISNPAARQELENIYTLQRLMHSAFDKTRNDIRFDLSKKILTEREIKPSFLKRIAKLNFFENRPSLDEP